MQEPRALLIAGLGNPGKKYALTRHNLGFMVVDELAHLFNMGLKEESRLMGFLAKKEVEQATLILLKPTTYMNLSGNSVRKVVDFFKLSPKELLVIVDDIDLPFGDFRLKDQGGTGGHNGLKSIRDQLGGNEYARLRIGVGDRDRSQKSLADHVLESFNRGEQELLPEIIQRAVRIIERLAKGESMETLMKEVNS